MTDFVIVKGRNNAMDWVECYPLKEIHQRCILKGEIEREINIPSLYDK